MKYLLSAKWLAIALVAACAEQTVAPVVSPYEDSKLVGTWYGESGVEGYDQKWLIQRRPSGNYEIVFLRCKEGIALYVQKEYGQWEHTDSDYTTRTELLSDGMSSWKPETSNGIYLEEYTVVELTASEFRYRNKNKEKTYSVQRVDEGFRMSCE
ncbi:hypothetical protein QWY82_15950 [Simiduia curdlanivorans]|uniref:Lipocalin-like domain-containing protein n=1 Tax=Simiduia curdlanivorans TaxID=1492769 RepID=A0ABV8UZB3_9GAMM|nr:hypothetical protein [Simiduia curdlanivorans]MDN3640290.1 hypothetical protein [Simiduia curdlanivorans]